MTEQQFNTLVDNLKDHRKPIRGDIVFIPQNKEYWVIDKYDNVKVFPLEKWFEAGNRARKERGEEILKL
jgi:hypothetical protein